MSEPQIRPIRETELDELIDLLCLVLAVEAPHLVPLYRVLVARCLPYAQERGVLTDSQIQAIVDVLKH